MVGKDYDEFDIRDARNAGFWTGALAGSFGTFVLCLLLGFYFSS
jgi:hypothetical protein